MVEEHTLPKLLLEIDSGLTSHLYNWQARNQTVSGTYGSTAQI